MANKYYFSTRDLLLIALLCCLGGVTSAYTGYLADALHGLTGIPMGGQALSGLHVFWILLVLALVDRKGAGATAGLLKGFVEFASGSHLSILAIPTSLLEGIFAEIGFRPLKKYRVIAYPLAGGLGAWANVLVTQTLFNAFPGIALFTTISALAFASGIVFAGFIGLAVVRSLEESRMSRKPEYVRAFRLASRPGLALAILLMVAAAAFAAHFAPYLDRPGGSTIVMNATGSTDHLAFTDGCESMGTNTYDLMDYQSQFVTVIAIDPTGGNAIARNYTGLPLVELVNMQCRDGAPRFVDVISKDGSVRTFRIPEVRANASILIAPNGTAFDIVAPGYPADMWVKNVDSFRQY